MMCCEPHGSSEEAVSECHDCGARLDKDGEPLEVCGYAPHSEACKTCGANPCTGYC